jgi:hypothetical protein
VADPWKIIGIALGILLILGVLILALLFWLFKYRTSKGQNTPPIIARKNPLVLVKNAPSVRQVRLINQPSIGVLTASSSTPEPLHVALPQPIEIVSDEIRENTTSKKNSKSVVHIFKSKNFKNNNDNSSNRVSEVKSNNPTITYRSVPI